MTAQLARELIQSYVSCRRFDPGDYAERIKMIFAEKRIIGFGYSTKGSGETVISGHPLGRIGRAASCSREWERHARSTHRLVFLR